MFLIIFFVYLMKLFNRCYNPFTTDSKFKIEGINSSAVNKYSYRISKLFTDKNRFNCEAMCGGSTATMALFKDFATC